MAKISSPILFSKHFNIDERELFKAGLIDPFLNVDTPLFIDPVLLSQSSSKIIKSDGHLAFRKRFSNIIRFLDISQNVGDAPWRAAWKALDLSEPPETGLGYGSSGRSGSSRPDHVRTSILETTQEIITLGSKDPDMIALMGFFEENVGPDTISDFTTSAIFKQLCELTETFCNEQGIEGSETNASFGHKIPQFLAKNGNQHSIVLIPKDILRDLPTANDWSEIERAALESRIIRDRVNAYLGRIAKPTILERKAAMRSAALGSANLFEQFLASVKEHARSYDPALDALNYYKFRSILRQDNSHLKIAYAYNFEKRPDDLKKLVLDTIEIFRRHIEDGNLWEELWLGDKPKKERAAQLIYYAIADSFCIANNVDISPEANMGGGPVDFKFSKGFDSRILVEMKRSSGTVVHGYKKQLEVYKKAAQTSEGIFVVINYGDLGNKLRVIQTIRQLRLDAGEYASDIIVIDATKKKSASKRK